MSRTVLIGLDGATFSVLDPLMEQGVMPFLRSFVASGVRAPLRTIVPPLTPPAWTSLLTGRTPGHHGIYDFFQLEAPGSKTIRLTTSRDVRTQTVADMVNQQGLRASVLNFPAHFPPPPIDGHVIAGWMPWRQLRLGCHPQGLYDRLRALPGFDPRELAMDMELEARATEGAAEEELRDWAGMHARREEHWLEILRYLMTEEPTDLTAVLFDGPDKVQHLCWRFLDPDLATDLSPQERGIREACLDYFRRLDRVLAALVDLAGPEATVVMASDHGFGTTTEVFHINTWLERNGYLFWSDARQGAADEDGTLGMQQLTRHSAWIDWARTRAYVATPTSNGIHIVRAESNGGVGVSQEEYEAFRRQLMDALLGFREPHSGEPVVVAVATREEIFDGEAADYGADLTLTLRDGGLVSILPGEEPLVRRPQPAGAHRPLGILLARGPGIQRGVSCREISILDVAPLLLYSLDLELPDFFQGRMPQEFYEPEHLARHSVQIAATSAGAPHRNGDGQDAVYDAEAEAVMMARLRDLGYIE